MLLDELKAVLALLVNGIEDEESGRLGDALSGIDAAHTALTYALAVGDDELDAASCSLVEKVCGGLIETLQAKSKVSTFDLTIHVCSLMHVAIGSYIVVSLVSRSRSSKQLQQMSKLGLQMLNLALEETEAETENSPGAKGKVYQHGRHRLTEL